MTRQVIIAFALALTAVTSTALADDIHLKGAVRLDGAAGSVHLGDIARLDGPLAESFGDVVVAEMHGATLEVTLDQVRAALTAAGAHWGKLNLNGRRTVVRPRTTDAAAPQAMQAVSIVSDDASARRDAGARRDRAGDSALDFAEERTLRGDVARFIVRHLQIRPADLRLGFAGDDLAALRLSTDDLRFEKAPHGRVDNDVVELTVRAWRDQRVVRTLVFRVTVRVRTDVLVPTAAVARGDLLAHAPIATETRWLPAREAAAMAGPEALIGRTAVSRLEAGQPIRRGSVAAPIVVRRGDDVMVRCLVGGLVIALKAEARADGAAGDLVPMRKATERNTFLARVTGPGEAVVDLGEPVAAADQGAPR